jgi:hypothetical protein
VAGWASHITRLSLIEANPHRNLKTYPWIERKVEQLMHSIDGVGLWASVIGRPHGKRYQLAFGHHRIEAAERLKLKTIHLIIRQLSDLEMLQFMGRENGEDYSTDLLVLLNTWEGAVKFLANSKDYPSPRTHVRREAKPLEIARVLGWLSPDRSRDGMQMSRAARACSDAFALISGGYLSRDDLRGLYTSDAQEIVGRAQFRMEQMEQLATKSRAPRSEIEAAKRHIGNAATTTATSLKEGKLAHRDLRGQVDLHAYRFARDAKVQSPLFAAFGKSLVEQIERMLNTDVMAEKLGEVRKARRDGIFSDDTAARTQRSKRDIARDAARFTDIPLIAECMDTSLDEGKELDALAALDHDIWESLIRSAASDVSAAVASSSVANPIAALGASTHCSARGTPVTTTTVPSAGHSASASAMVESARQITLMACGPGRRAAPAPVPRPRADPAAAA